MLESGTGHHPSSSLMALRAPLGYGKTLHFTEYSIIFIQSGFFWTHSCRYTALGEFKLWATQRSTILEYCLSSFSRHSFELLAHLEYHRDQRRQLSGPSPVGSVRFVGLLLT
jgi:hypothetical protein